MGTVTLRPALLALGGAALFGLSVPAGKRLLADLPPPVLAGLLYLGSGLGLGAWRLGRGGALLRLPPGSWPTLLATAAAGGVAAPLCLMEGLRRSEGQAASVLLSLEAVFTAILAAALFREHVGRAAWGAVGLAAGAAILLAEPWAGTDRPDGVGLLLVALATAGWALDNNLSRRLSDRDPVQVAALKGLVAGPACLGVALLLGSPVPTDPLALGGAAAVGLLSYGLSLVLVLRAFAGLGAARTMAIFGAAPAFGAAGCWAFLGERPGPALLGAGALLAAGGWLLSRERHDHEHVHEAMEHEHPHRHDDGHHDHVHEGWEGPEPHVHRHRHAPLVHSHPHAPDLHHRHGHGGDHSQECRTFM